MTKKEKNKRRPKKIKYDNSSSAMKSISVQEFAKIKGCKSEEELYEALAKELEWLRGE